MTSEEEMAGLRAKVADLTNQLDTYKNRDTELTEQLRAANLQSWETNSLLIGLQSDLLNPVYAILTNSEVLHTASETSHRSRLALANQQAARLLERTLIRLIDLARIATHDFRLSPSKCSVHSLTHGALLLTASARRPNSKIRFSADIQSDDVIVSVDEYRLTHLLSSAMLSVTESLTEANVSLSVRQEEQGANVMIHWLVTVTETSDPLDLDSALQLPSPGRSMAGRVALGVRFTKALADALQADFTVQEVPPGLQVSMSVPLIHHVEPIGVELANEPWSKATVVVADEPPPGFTPLGTTVAQLPADIDVHRFIKDSDAKLLVLHQSPDRDGESLARNLALCKQSNVPILLRASDITYEQFQRYRYNVDAIVLEPASEEVLFRYVVGMSTHDRRKVRRPAELH